MGKGEFLALTLVIMATIGIGAGSLLYQHLQEDKETIEILARSPEAGNWYPAEIRIKQYRPTVLQIKNVDGVSHGFTLPAFNIRIEEIKAGEIAQVSFTPDKAGIFSFYCTIWCSPKHMKMVGKLKIEDGSTKPIN
jgi:heme/copper-type cytochrome/quinol oxidase subunit 2